MALPTTIYCPRAKTAETPCVARDQALALTNGSPDGVCVGCGHDPRNLLRELAARWPEAPEGLTDVADTERAADLLAAHVAVYVNR